MSNNTKIVSGFPFCSILCLVFITLKLLGKIAWSWLWVLSPIWIPLSVVAAICLVIGIVYVIAKMVK